MRELFQQTLLNGVSAGTGDWVRVAGAEHLTFYVEWSAGGSLGVVELEEARETSAPVGSIKTVTQADADVADPVHAFGHYRYVRARLSTGVTGGTVTVMLAAASAAH